MENHASDSSKSSASSLKPQTKKRKGKGKASAKPKTRKKCAKKSATATPQVAKPPVDETTPEDALVLVPKSRKRRSTSSPIWDYFERVVLVERNLKLVEVGKTFDTVDPVTGEVKKEVAQLRPREEPKVVGYCKLCNETDRTPYSCGSGTTSSLLRHLELEHFDIWAKTDSGKSKLAKTAGTKMIQPSVASHSVSCLFFMKGFHTSKINQDLAREKLLNWIVMAQRPFTRTLVTYGLFIIV